MFTKKVGDQILVKASKFLGTPAEWADVVEVNSDHYLVKIDGEDWEGEVDHDGVVLMSGPFEGFVRAE